MTPRLKACAASSLLSLLLAGGCGAVPQGSGARYACYDFAGRLVVTVNTKAECEFRDWDWREKP